MGRDVAYDLASYKKAEAAAQLATRNDASKRKKKPNKTSKVGTLARVGIKRPHEKAQTTGQDNIPSMLYLVL